MSDQGAIVCGFADEAAAVVGLAWSVGAGGGMIVREGKTSPASAAIEPDGEAVSVRFEGDGLSCDASLTPRPGEVPLPAEAVESGLPGPSAAICAVRASLRDDGGERRLDCTGHLTRWRGDPTDGAQLLRHLAIPGPDRSLLLLTAIRAEGAEHHGDEGVAAWQLDPEGGAVAFGEALLSTQYGEEGRPVRAGLELWRSSPDSPPVRAAGTLERETGLLEGPVTIAALHTSAEGSEGIGSYLLWRR